MNVSFKWLLLSCVLIAVMAAALAGGGTARTVRPHARAITAKSPPPVTARRLRPRAGALRRGTRVRERALFGERVFSNAQDGFALANGPQAQYPAISTDGGRSWRVDGPQFHIDAADGPEAVTSVGIISRRTFFAYGSSVVDVTTDAGRTWWEAFLGGLVVAVVPGFHAHSLVAFVQGVSGGTGANSAVTSQYVSRDGGHHWRYSSALGGG